MADLDHLSYSSINSYLLCPRAWKYHYIDKVQVPTAAALVFGSAFHETVEEHLKTAFATDRVPVLDRWQRHWAAQLERNPDIDWGQDSAEELCNTGVRMLSADDVAGTIANLVPLVTSETPAIEEYVELRVPGVPIPVIGYVDVIEQDGVPCDLKTSSRAWSANKAQDELQPIFYLAALNQAGYDLNPDFKFRHYVFTKAKKPQVQVWETTRTFSDLFWLFGLIADVWHGIEREVFPPNPSTWKCGEKYCEYWSICRGKVL